MDIYINKSYLRDSTNKILKSTVPTNVNSDSQEKSGPQQFFINFGIFHMIEL